MNILEVVSGHAVNGAVMHCLLLSRELARRGHTVTVVCRHGAWIERACREEGLPVVASDLHRWPSDELRRIAALVGERGIDLVHTHMSRAHFFGVLLKWFSDVAVVATAHSRRIQPHWMANDAVIAVAEAVGRFQRTWNRVDGSRLHVIHPFVDVSRFVPSAIAERRRVRAAIGIGESPVLGAVGSIFREKRIVELVRAFADVLRTVGDARLVLVGDGPPDYIDRVKAQAASLGVTAKIHFTGHRTDVPDIMGALDLLVVTSADEAFPLVIAEAMAAGLPVVATVVGGTAELVIDGTTGILARPGDQSCLVEALVRLLGDPVLRRRFGEAGRVRALECFSAATQVDKVEALFDAVLREQGC